MVGQQKGDKAMKRDREERKEGIIAEGRYGMIP